VTHFEGTHHEEGEPWASGILLSLLVGGIQVNKEDSMKYNQERHMFVADS
jgi:hypothetical protein